MKNKNIFIVSIIAMLLFSCGLENLGVGSYDENGSVGITDEEGSGKFNEIIENEFIDVDIQPTSTFSVDADGGSYAHVRGYINSNQKPPKNSIRVEEFLNYFPLDYLDDGINSISLNGEVSKCPWQDGHKLIRVGIKGKELNKQDYPIANFVLLIDVSGSMSNAKKLPLIKEGFKKFVDQMRDQDRLAIVTYAGNAGVLLQSTPGTKKEYIKSQIDKLGSGGSTAGAEGINTAYKIVEQNFIENGNNRVILGTDGDFNVGVSSQDDLIELIEEKRKSNAFLTTIGVGYANEGMLEQLANKGNGNYEYIDQIEEMEKVFINDYNKFVTVAKDVKVQVTFNPEMVKQYRLIGYANRLLKEEDFENDTIDAGEIGAGQNITALYEIIPQYDDFERSQKAFTIDFRYKEYNEDFSTELSLDIDDNNNDFHEASENMRFSAAIASYGMLLFDSKYYGNSDYDKVYSWVNNAKTYNPYGYRTELLELIKKAKEL